MIEESADFHATERPCKPLHVVLHEDLHGCAVDPACTLNGHAHATTDGHVRAKETWMSRRIGAWANRGRRAFAVSPFVRFFPLRRPHLRTASAANRRSSCLLRHPFGQGYTSS